MDDTDNKVISMLDRIRPPHADRGVNDGEALVIHLDFHPKKREQNTSAKKNRAKAKRSKSKSKPKPKPLEDEPLTGEAFVDELITKILLYRYYPKKYTKPPDVHVYKIVAKALVGNLQICEQPDGSFSLTTTKTAFLNQVKQSLVRESANVYSDREIFDVLKNLSNIEISRDLVFVNYTKSQLEKLEKLTSPYR